MGARKFMPVSPSIWNRHTLSLGKDVTIVYVYLLTNKHRNSEGLYHLPRAYIVGDLGGSGITAEAIDAALEDLRSVGLIKYDYDADVVFIPNALLLQPPGSPNQLRGAIKKLREVPPTPLMNDLYMQALAYCNEPNAKGESLPAMIEKAFPEVANEAFPQVTTVDEPLGNSLASTGSESESAVRRKGPSGGLSMVNGNGFHPVDPSTQRAREDW